MLLATSLKKHLGPAAELPVQRDRDTLANASLRRGGAGIILATEAAKLWDSRTSGRKLHGADWDSGWILVVDDDPAILDVIVQVLNFEGHHAEGCRNGQEALDILREATPSLILLDLWMPKMNGWEFRHQQLKTPEVADIPVVLLSAGGNLPQHAEDLHAAAIIAKPFDLGQLLTTVEEVIRGSAA